MNRANPMVVLTVALVTALVFAAVLPAGSVTAANDTISSLSVAGSPFATDLALLPRQVRLDLVLSRKARVTIAVFDANGTRVRRLARGVRRPAGQHSWHWDGTKAGAELPDGIYTPSRSGPGTDSASRWRGASCARDYRPSIRPTRARS